MCASTVISRLFKFLIVYYSLINKWKICERILLIRRKLNLNFMEILTVSSENFHFAEAQATLNTDQLQKDVLSHECSGTDEGLRDTFLCEFDLSICLN